MGIWSIYVLISIGDEILANLHSILLFLEQAFEHILHMKEASARKLANLTCYWSTKMIENLVKLAIKMGDTDLL